MPEPLTTPTGGQFNDRILGGGLGTVIAYVVVSVLGVSLTDPETGQLAPAVIPIFGAAGTLGTMIGTSLPESYRVWLQAVAALAAAAIGTLSVI